MDNKNKTKTDEKEIIKFKLAGCVILYNPDNDAVDNISSYVEYLDMLYVVDNKNGRSVFEKLGGKYKNIELVSYSENMGIAKPLNDVLKMVKGKYTHLLTMDQDSFFEEEDIKKYIGLAKAVDWKNVLGVAPWPISKNMPKSQKGTNSNLWKEFSRVITSGNIISVTNALTIGGFDEKLFIDEVDHDFCYRGRSNGFKILASKSVCLNHQLGGEYITIKFMGKTVNFMNHNYIRTYYIIRNRIYVIFKDWKTVDKFYYLYDTFWVVVGKCFFEKDKLRKIRSIFVAVKDAMFGNMEKKEFKY